MPVLDKSGSWAIAFLIGAEVVFALIAFTCSSPQTTELNAEARSETLMKWVNVGAGSSVAFLGIAAMAEPTKAVPILTGGGLALGLAYVLYHHARDAGLSSNLPPTENWERNTSVYSQA